MTLGNYADWMYVLCRTGTEESRHRGITMLLVDAHQAGVDVRPIRNIAGGLEFCEVFFDDVRTPAELVVGEVNGGWNVAMDTLGMERTGAMSPYMATFEAEMTRLLDEVARRRSGESPVMRQRLAKAWAGLQVLQYMNQRLLAAELTGGDAGAVGSVLKIYWSRWHRSFGELMLDVFGAEALVVERRRRAQLVPAHVPQLARRDDLRRRRRDPAQHRRRARARPPPRTALTVDR